MDTTTTNLAVWQRVWRDGIAPNLSDNGLLALNRALERDDSALIQCATTQPPPLHAVQDWSVEGACAITYASWQGDGLGTVGEVEEYFARICYEADQRLNEPGACRYFLNWFDERPREEMRVQLLQEVNLLLAQRTTRAQGGAA
jgi:hypothetical protein